MTTTTDRLPRLGAVDPIPTHLATIAPEPITRASDEYAEALDRLREAHRAVGAAEDALKQAAETDRANATAAVEAAKPVPPATEPSARVELETCRRAVPPNEHLAQVALAGYRGALLEHLDDFQAALADALALVGQDVAQTVDDLDALLRRAQMLKHTQREVGNGDYVAGRQPSLRLREPPKGWPAPPVLDELREALAV